MWNELFDYFKNNAPTKYFKTIFVHNLGGFDGVFIFKYLVKLFVPKGLEAKPIVMMDESSKYIRISISVDQDHDIKFIDDYFQLV